MKLILFVSIVIQILTQIFCIKLDIKFKEELPQRYLRLTTNRLDTFHSCFLTKSEDPDFNELFTDHLTESKNEIFPFKSTCYNSLCDDFLINSTHGTLSSLKFCPLKGQFKKAELFVNKNYYERASFTPKLLIMIKGCSFQTEIGKRVEITWIVSVSFQLSLTVLKNIGGNEHLYKRFRSEDIFMNNLSRECSNLCESVECESPTIVFDALNPATGSPFFPIPSYPPPENLYDYTPEVVGLGFDWKVWFYLIFVLVFSLIVALVVHNFNKKAIVNVI